MGWLLERVFDVVSLVAHAGDKRRRATAATMARRKAWEDASNASPGCECSRHRRSPGRYHGVRDLGAGKIR